MGASVRKLYSWKVIAAGWALYGVVMSIESYVIRERLGRPISWGAAFGGDMSYSAVWALLTPLVLWFVRRYPIERSSLGRRLTLHAGLSFGFALFHKVAHNLLTALYRITFEGAVFSWEGEYRSIISYFDYGIQLYWIILLLDYAHAYYTQVQEKELVASRLESQLMHAQLNVLKMQLQPHFLFNTLNAIAVLIDEDPKSARTMLDQLSDLLRMSLEYSRHQVIPLHREMEFLTKYLGIQQTRFGGRLTVTSSVDPAAAGAYVPSMILQPVVENAIRHGISSVPGPGRIEISAERRGPSVLLRARDTGPGINGASQRNGVGLANTQARLRQLYGDEQSMEFDNVPGGGLLVTITLPYRDRPVSDSADE